MNRFTYKECKEYWYTRKWDEEIDDDKHQISLEIKSLIEDIRFDSVLDFGCGIGQTSKILFSQKEYLGVDFSKRQIEIARIRYPLKKFLLVDASQSNWTPPDVDLLFTHTVLEHIPSPEFEQITDRLLKCCKMAIFVEADIEKALWKKEFPYGFNRDYKTLFNACVIKINDPKADRVNSIFIIKGKRDG